MDEIIVITCIFALVLATIFMVIYVQESDIRSEIVYGIVNNNLTANETILLIDGICESKIGLNFLKDRKTCKTYYYEEFIIHGNHANT